MADFDRVEEFEEALGYWFTHQGRVLALTASQTQALRHVGIEHTQRQLPRRPERMIEFIVGLVVVVLILIVSLTNKDDLKRYQELQNKRRFSGKRLPSGELAELEKMAR